MARTADRVHAVAADVDGTCGIVGDVSRKEDIYPIAMQITAALGGLDVLVNNASSLGPVPLVPLADTDCEDFEAALATNVVGPFRLTKALLGALAASAREARAPLILNISSDAAEDAVSELGRLRREQGGAPSPHAHLARGAGRPRHRRCRGRSRRHGHADARARGARRRSATR